MLGGAKPWQLEGAITEKTACIATVFGPFIRSGLPLPELAAIGRKHSIPVIVDAAAEVPPMSNLTRFIKEGADLVMFSGGKGTGGPQGAGLLARAEGPDRSCLRERAQPAQPQGRHWPRHEGHQGRASGHGDRPGAVPGVR